MNAQRTASAAPAEPDRRGPIVSVSSSSREYATPSARAPPTRCCATSGEMASSSARIKQGLLERPRSLVRHAPEGSESTGPMRVVDDGPPGEASAPAGNPFALDLDDFA